MNLMSMESIFLMLSGVILFAGILYWFWSHIQLTQKKVQLLENAVFELRGMMTPPGGPPPSPGPSSSSGGAPPPAYDDLPDDDWGHDDTVLADANDIRSTPLTEIGAASGHRDVLVSREDDDLMPGGAPALHVSENGDEQEQQPHEDFRELFVSQEVATPVRTPESLESMPVKELRRLAEQRGIAGAADMRKKEILAALRKQVQPAGEVAVQKTLDLTVEAEVEAEVPVEENTGAEAEILE